LLDRGDSESAIKLPLGIIPAGTGNGMAKSVLDLSGEACDAATATFAIIRGHKQALDVAAVVQGQVTYHSILMLSWGTTFATSYIENSKCKYYHTLVLLTS
jgi:sphingosine kinase